MVKSENNECRSVRAGALFHQSIGVDTLVPTIALFEVGSDKRTHDAIQERAFAFDTRDKQLDRAASVLSWRGEEPLYA